MRWVCWHPDTDTPWVDVMPIEDLIVHEQGEGCVCGPDPEYVDPDTGESYLVPLYSHHSLDGREANE